MKNALKKMPLLFLGLLLYSCNEKISPELENGNSTTAPTVIVPSEYYFKLTNNSATVLNYVLHRTGPNNESSECKISSSRCSNSSYNTEATCEDAGGRWAPVSGLAPTNDLFISDSGLDVDDKYLDISCFMEAEELALFHNGLSFKIEASANTCEYIGYSPYSFFDSLPGSSSTTYAGVVCDDGISNADATAFTSQAVTGVSGGIEYGANVSVPCGQMVDLSVTEANRVPVPIPDDKQSLCSFDYETNGGGNGQNCDTGRISFRFVNVFDADEGDATNPDAKMISEPAHDCDGSIAACIGGAIKSVEELANNSRGTIITRTELNKAFSQTWELPSLMGVRSANYDIVNYRKGLGAVDMNFINYDSANESEWGDTSSNMSFDPNVFEKYSANRKPDNTVIIDTENAGGNVAVTYANYITQITSGGTTKKYYAADPFLGLNGVRINPFYTFFCFDRAFDVKARIRMVVRDWDRVFPSDTSALTLLSDTYKPVASRRQDLPSSEEEVPDDVTMHNYFNDIDDWDNLVEMDRTDTGGLTYSAYQALNGSGTVIWEPTDGWWSSSIFPNQGPRTDD